MEIDRKRTAANGDVPGAKRLANAGRKELVTAEDIEEFQKEAILRQMHAYRRERDELQAQLDAARSGGDDGLRRELETVTEKYVEAARQVERLQSATVARVLFTGTEPPAEAATATAAAAAAASAGSTPREGDADAAAASPKELLEARSRAAALEAEVAKKTDFLAEEEQRRARLEADVRELEAQLAAVPAAAQGFELRQKEFAAENARLAVEAQQLQQKVAELRGGEADYEKSIREKFAGQQQALERRLAAAEADVARIRGLRDDLLSELNVLRAENAERQTEVRNLKEELALHEKPAEAAAVAADSSSAAAAPDAALSADLPSDAADLRERCLALIRQNTALSSEISGLEQGFARANSKAKASQKSVAAIEQKLSVLNTAKVRSDEKYFGAMRARDAASQELARLKAALTKSTEVVAELKSTEQRLTAQVAKLQKQEGQHGLAMQQRQREYDALQRAKREVEGMLSVARVGADKLKEQLQLRDAEKMAAETSRRHAETQAEKFKRQLETQQAISGLGAPAEVREQLESLRSIAMCPVCQKNWKDRALTTCGHTMCADCVKSRLAARMRKCPMCNGHFASNDVLSIHL